MRDLIPSMLVGLVLPAVVLLTVAAIPPYGEPAAGNSSSRLQPLKPKLNINATSRCISHQQIGFHQADQLLH